MKLSVRYVKIWKTAALYSSFFAMGLFVAIPGPTLLDLERIVQVETRRITYIYLARSSSYLLGSLIGGFLFDLITKKQVLLIFCNFLMGVSAIATPWCRSLPTLISMWALGGLFAGGIDTCANVICLDLWGKESAPYLQALHFAFGVGAFVAPLVAAPFLEKTCSSEYINSTLDVINNTTNEFNSSSVSLIFSNDTKQNECQISSPPLITYPYSIIGAYALLNGICYIVLSIVFPDKKTKKERTESQIANERSFNFTLLVISIATLSLGAYCGIEMGYGQMLTTYAVKGDLKLSKVTGSYITSLYWGTFSFGRGIGILLATKFSAVTLIAADLTAILISCAILIAFGNIHEEALWAGTFILALGLASFFPSTISWLERYITFNNKISSVFIMATALSEMVIPLAVGHFMEKQPQVLVYIALGCGIAGCIFSFLLWIIMSRKGEKYISDKSDTVQTTSHVQTDESRT